MTYPGTCEDELVVVVVTMVHFTSFECMPTRIEPFVVVVVVASRQRSSVGIVFVCFDSRVQAT